MKKNHKRNIVLLYICMFLPGCFESFNTISMEPLMIQNKQDIINLFPQTSAQIKKQADAALAQAKSAIENIINIPADQRTFDTIARALDQAATDFSDHSGIISTLFYLHPDQTIRQAAQTEQVRMSQEAIDIFEYNIPLYQAFKEYVEKKSVNESLSPEQRYFIEETMKEFKRAGLELPEEQRNEIKELTKQITELSAQFSKNINESKNSITATELELEGLDQDFIKSLKKNNEGLYILGTDYPTYFKVMDNAAHSDLRKRLYFAFTNRAYPDNYPLLEQIIVLRDKIAKILGYKSYAHYRLENSMAQSPETVEQFLANLLAKAQAKSEQEIQKFKQNLPANITLSSANKFWPWDLNYTINHYKKNRFALDEEKIAEYFPMEHTIKQLLNIYEQFLNINFKEQPLAGLWDPEIKLIEVYNNNTLLGYILLDLYPREGKYSHAAKLTIINSHRLPNGSRNPALAVIMANFPKSTATKPSLLRKDDVQTFFHEFGHGIHSLLSKTELGTQAGTQVKTDFVEMPSQMLEEWLWDRDILKMVSKHYQTNEPLPDALINTLLALKNMETGIYIMRQGTLAQVSLGCYQEGEKKDLDVLYKKLATKNSPYLEFSDNNHFIASFGHLTGYGPQYYGYLWSKVYALDLFETIKKQGLLNPEIGTVYAEKILAKGGSCDPNKLLEDFLGRKPNDKAFLKDMGL